MSPRPFRFGVAVYGDGSIEDWRELARRTEGLGYSTLLLGDHFVEYLPISGMSPLFCLAAAASVTTTLRFGTAMLGNDFRHPVTLAKDAASLDVLSDGRFELGIGAGWYRRDYEALGIQYDRASVRVERLEESIAVIKQAWSGKRFDFTGKYYTLQDYAGLPKPAQDPRPPIVIGGGSERILKLAGREADIVGIHVSTASFSAKDGPTSNTQADQTLMKLAWIKEGAAERFQELELQMMCSAKITDDRNRAATEVAFRTDTTPEHVLESAMYLIGTAEQICDQLQERRARWGVSYITVPAEACSTFAPVVAALVGT